MPVTRKPPQAPSDYSGPEDFGSALEQTLRGGEGKPGQFLTPLGGYLKHRLGQAIEAISRTDPGIGPGITAGRPVTSGEQALSAYSKSALGGGTPSLGVAKDLHGMADELRPGVVDAIRKFREQYVAPGRENMGDVLRVLESTPEGKQWSDLTRSSLQERAAFGRLPEPLPASTDLGPMQPGFSPPSDPGEQRYLDFMNMLRQGMAEHNQPGAKVIPFPKKGK